MYLLVTINVLWSSGHITLFAFAARTLRTSFQVYNVMAGVWYEPHSGLILFFLLLFSLHSNTGL